MWVQFLEYPPLKFGRAKNVQISARFLTTFDFDRECLPNGSTFRKSKKNWWPKLTFHSHLRRRADSRLALPRTSSCSCITLLMLVMGDVPVIDKVINSDCAYSVLDTKLFLTLTAASEHSLSNRLVVNEWYFLLLTSVVFCHSNIIITRLNASRMVLVWHFCPSSWEIRLVFKAVLFL